MGMPQTDLPRVLTVKEVAALLRVHPSTIYRLLREGDLPGFRVGVDWRFNSDQVVAWIVKNTDDRTATRKET